MKRVSCSRSTFNGPKNVSVTDRISAFHFFSEVRLRFLDEGSWLPVSPEVANLNENLLRKT